MNQRALHSYLEQVRHKLAATPRRLRLETGILISALIVFSLGFIVQSRQAAIQEAQVAVANMTSLLGDQARLVFETTDVTLRSLAVQLEREAIEHDDVDFRTFMRDARDHLGIVRALFVIGPDGFITHDTDYPNTPRVSLEDRRYFQALRDDPTLEMFVGRPILSRSVAEWFVPISRRIQSPDGEFTGIVVAAVDPLFVEQTYGRLQLQPGDAIALFHQDGTLIASSPPQPDLYGKAPEGLELFRSHVPRAPVGVYRATNPLSDQPSIVGYERLKDYPLLVTLAHDQSEAMASWKNSIWLLMLMDALVIALIVLLYSILSRRELERQAHRQQALMQEKLETVGYMTSGVAHDFKNLVSVIHAGVRSLRRQGADENLLVHLEDAIDRGDRLTNELLCFAKDHEVNKIAIDPDAQIAKLEGLLRRCIAVDVDLQLRLSANDAQIMASPALFDAAVMNLVINASHAMGDGGRLVISTRVVQGDEHQRLAGGNFVAVMVEDTGKGIPAASIETLFSPFVTSKKEHGTGLGLYQTRQFAVDTGGDISVQSEVGQGTRVEIMLPCIGQSI
ncbi:ATP-binding protein [Neptunicoccus sediminis]|uniref:ATP-binding protein n=1 Tax=Neptunicoccus sediminis TaxID=1892596 RepID=UPI0008462087|nr:ATP-binding protein [Neptunicoccus sediminis]